MIKKIYILLIFIIGFALTPNLASACSAKAEKVCCKKEKTKKIDSKNCCKKAKQQSNDKEVCDGKCGDKSCHCPTIDSSFIIPLFFQINNDFYFSNENQKLSYVKTYVSSGFYNIWSPPNIN